MDTITDPFQSTPANAMAITALTRELTAMPNIDTIRAAFQRKNGGRDWREPEQNEQQEIAKARQAGPSCQWSELDSLAIRRAGAAIIAADGRGVGVTKNEARELDSREPDAIRRAIRKIVSRLAEPAIDGLILEKAESMSPFLPEADA